MKNCFARAVRASEGYRLYASQSVKRVCGAVFAGTRFFASGVVRHFFPDRGGIPCRKVRTLAEEKLHRVEQSLKELRALQRQIRETLRDWDRRHAETGKGKRAELLGTLGDVQRKPRAQMQTSKKGFIK